MNLRLTLVALSVGLAAAGCGRDRDAEDYRREKLAEEIAKLNQIAGTYRGAAVSRADNGPLGALTIELRSGTKFGGRKDGFEAEELPALRGTVYFESGEGRPAATQFKDAFYDSDTGAFRATVELPRRARTVEINIQGSVHGPVLKGSIEADGFIAQGGDFTLVKDGPRPDPSTLKREAPKQGGADPLEIGEFTGTGTFWNGASARMTLVLDSSIARSEDRFINLLMPVKFVQATLDVGPENGFSTTPLHFSDTEWDERYGTLIGESAMSTGTVRLECLWDKPAKAFGCTITNPIRGRVATGQLKGGSRGGVR